MLINQLIDQLINSIYTRYHSFSVSFCSTLQTMPPPPEPWKGMAPVTASYDALIRGTLKNQPQYHPSITDQFSYLNQQCCISMYGIAITSDQMK